jgi:hypothetical protein
MSISTVPKHFTISAHTPYGNASDSSHDSEKSQPLPKQYPMNPAPQPHSNKTTPASEQNTSTVQDGPTTSPSLAHGHQFLLSVEIQLQPNKDHLDVMLYETREILRYIQQVDPTAKFLSKSSPSCPTPPPPLVRPDDINWPHNYMTSTNWFHTSSKYLFQFPPISEKQLTARLETRRNKKYESSITNKTKQKSNIQDDKGPTSLYTTLHLWSSLTTIDSLVDSINIDLQKSNIKVTIKTLQSWDSESRKILCGVNNGLCTVGVQQLLEHHLKAMEKKLYRHGKLDTLEWYDKPLPQFHMTTRGIRSLKLPDDPREKKRLTFDTFPWGSKLAYFLEADNTAWTRLEPLLQLLVDSNILSKHFGPSAFIMDVPDNNPKIGKIRAHHEYGQIHMGYNVATTIIERNEVQIYDYEVKVVMEDVEETDEEGNPTGHRTRPKPPYSKTTLRNELHRIRIDGDQIFHTAIMVCKGPESGISNVVITYDTQDPLYKEKIKFAQHTINNLACFMFHWLKRCGYSAGTRTRLMRSFYEDKNLMAEHSSWDEDTLTVTPHFPVRKTPTN